MRGGRREREGTDAQFISNFSSERNASFGMTVVSSLSVCAREIIGIISGRTGERESILTICWGLAGTVNVCDSIKTWLFGI